MLGDFSCRVALQLLGYVYPAYKTYKVVQLPATRSNDTLLRHWCCYWALMAVFTALQPLADTFIFWLPLYYEAKLAFAVYLWANDLAGAQYVWGRWFQPLVSRYEPVVDRGLAESKALASDWLHSNTMRLLALAQAKVLHCLAQVQLQAQQAAGIDNGGGSGEGAAGAAPLTRRGSSKRRSSREPGEGKRGSGEDVGAATAATTAAGEGQGLAGGGGGGSKGRAGVDEAVPAEPLAACFSSFSLHSFYSSLSADLQAQDLKAGLKGFPILSAGGGGSSSSKDVSPHKDE